MFEIQTSVCFVSARSIAIEMQIKIDRHRLESLDCSVHLQVTSQYSAGERARLWSLFRYSSWRMRLVICDNWINHSLVRTNSELVFIHFAAGKTQRELHRNFSRTSSELFSVLSVRFEFEISFHLNKMYYHSVLITGANRGIGLQLVKEFLKLGNSKVLATYRDPSTAEELNELAKSNSNLSLLQLESKNYAGYDAFRDQVAAIVGDNGLSLLINNAGIALRNSLNDVTAEQMLENYDVNVVAPLMLSKALLPLLKKSSSAGHRTVIAHMSSQLGSIEDNKVTIQFCRLFSAKYDNSMNTIHIRFVCNSLIDLTFHFLPIFHLEIGGYYSYRVSKSALNQVGKSMSVDLQKDSIAVTLLHPGWVRTRLGTDRAKMSVEESASQMVNVLIDKSRELNGKFLNYAGAELPW